MINEELMQPRYKVIADYPFNKYHPVGKVIIVPTDNYAVNVNGVPVFYCEFADFPYLFQKLEWWEDRKVEDMPEYVHFKEGEFENYFKVHEHLVSKGWCLVAYPKDRILVDYPYSTLTPCTEEEYTAYQSRNKKPVTK